MIRWSTFTNLTATHKHDDDIPNERPLAKTYFSAEDRGPQVQFISRSLGNLSVKKETIPQQYLTKSQNDLSHTQLDHFLVVAKKLALGSSTILTEKEPETGFTHLHLAIEENDLDLVQLITDLSPETILEQDHEGNNAVHLAAKFGSTRSLQLMMKTTQGLQALTIRNHNNACPINLFLHETGRYPFRAGLTSVNPKKTLVAYYPEWASTAEQKHQHDAAIAKLTLQDQGNVTLINLIAKTISRLVLNMKEEIFNEYIYEIHQDIQRCNFPTSKLVDYSSKVRLSETLLELTLDDKNHIIDIMAVLWRLVEVLLENQDVYEHDRLYEIYCHFDIIGRNHHVAPGWEEKVTEDNRDRFHFQPLENMMGEAKVSCNLFSNLNALKQLSHYYSEHEPNKKSSAQLYRNNKSTGIPYLSGTSGMSNGFFAIYPLLNIEFHSEAGCRLAEIMTAFMVGTGLHTAKECRDAIMITHEYLKHPGTLMVDYRCHAGLFDFLHDPVG